MLWYYICMPASVTNPLISSHGGLVLQALAAQMASGRFVVRAFGFTPRATPRFGVCEPEGPNLKP